MKTETIFQVLLWSLFMATGVVGLRSAAQTDAPERRPYATVSGTVRDARTNRVLPAVHVAVPDRVFAHRLRAPYLSDSTGYAGRGGFHPTDTER